MRRRIIEQSVLFISVLKWFVLATVTGISYFSHPIDAVPAFSSSFFLEVCMAGVFFGICSFLLIGILKRGEKLSRSINLSKPVKALMGGGVIVILAFLLGTRYLGLGLGSIESALQGQDIPSLAFLFKMVFTSITLSFGGSGGIVTPIFFIGATSGNLFANVMGLDLQIFAAIGMVSPLAGAANTPIAASIMATELFGPKVAYAALACMISFLITGHRSVYPSQVLAVTKSSTLTVPEGQTMEEVRRKSGVKPRAKSVTGKLITGVNRAKRLLSRRRK